MNRQVPARYLLFLLCWGGIGTAQEQDNCLKLKKVFTSYDALRQGTSFEAHLTFQAPACTLALPAPGDDLHSRIRLEGDRGLKLDVKGLTSQEIERLKRLPPDTYGAHEQIMEVRITADRDAVRGMHYLSLLVNYETIDDEAHRIPRSVEIQIPVNVVARDAPVKARFDAPKRNPAQLLLIPFRLIGLLFWDGC